MLNNNFIKYSVIFLLVAVITAVVFCVGGCKPNKSKESNVSVIESEESNSILKPKEPKKLSEELKEKYRNINCKFEYSLKETYSSRNEVLVELNTLDDCFWQYKTSKGAAKIPIEPEAEALRLELRTKLLKTLEKFPPTQQDIKQARVNLFYSLYGDRVGALKNKAEILEKAMGEYEAGKITVEEALTQVGCGSKSYEDELMEGY